MATWANRLTSWIPWRRGAAPDPVVADDRSDSPVFSSPRIIRNHSPAFSVDASMEGYSRHAVVYACAKAIADDISSVPLRAFGADGAEVPRGDPLRRLLQRPTPRTGGVLLRAQLSIDLRLSGYAVLHAAGYAAGMGAVRWVRLHPARCRVETWDDGQPSVVVYSAGHGSASMRLRVGTEAILIRLPSWRADEGYGTGAIEPLAQTLATDRAAAVRSTEDAIRGRPRMIASPTLDGGIPSYGPQQREELEQHLQKLFDDSHGTIAVLSRPIDMQSPGWSPKDLAASELRDAAAREIMAVLGVPPARIGWPTANQQPARDQLRIYWLGIMSDARLVDEAITNWADSMAGYIGARVEHDFRRVRELQFPLDSAVTRLSQLVAAGVPLDAAMEIAGIDAPASMAAGAPKQTPASQPVADGERPMDSTPGRAQGSQGATDEDVAALVAALHSEGYHG
jgi:phage portal protein BeeE